MVSINRNLGNLNLQKANLVKVNTGATLKNPVKVGNVQAKPMADLGSFKNWDDYVKNKPENPQNGDIVHIQGRRFRYCRAQDGSMCLV